MDPHCNAERHGDLNAYNHYGCRCAGARKARMRIEKLRGLRVRALGHGLWITSTGTSRRLRALAALGWTTRDLARELGCHQPQVRRLQAGNARVHVDTAAHVSEVFERLSMTLGPSARTRRWAASQGWAPPLAWDNINDPAERPRGTRPRRYGPPHDDVDWAVVDALVDGTHRGRCTRGERLQAVTRLHREGLTFSEIAERVRRDLRVVTRDIAELRLTRRDAA